MSKNSNRPVPNADQFYPLNEPDIGKSFPEVRFETQICIAYNQLLTTASECISTEQESPEALRDTDHPQCYFQESHLCGEYDISPR